MRHLQAFTVALLSAVTLAVGVTYTTATLSAPAGTPATETLSAHLAQAKASMDIFCQYNNLGEPSVWAERGEVYGACERAGNAVVPVAPAPAWADNRTADDKAADAGPADGGE